MRTVYQADALDWLRENAQRGPIVTSPPDMQETGQEYREWRQWYLHALYSCMAAQGENLPAVFYVTDRRYRGELLSKAGFVLRMAGQVHRKVLWHKIALRLKPGTEDSRRPGFVHVIAVGGSGCSPGFDTPSSAWPDVFDMGPRLYKNGMGVEAARMAVGYCSRFGSTIVNPFCGRGTVLAVAEERGLDAVGVDSDPDMCELARTAQAPRIYAVRVEEKRNVR